MLDALLVEETLRVDRGADRTLLIGKMSANEREQDNIRRASQREDIESRILERVRHRSRRSQIRDNPVRRIIEQARDTGD